jgi:hypothetical protein
MKKHRITRKKKTLKKYSKARFRRLNKKTIKMKGGAGASEYIKYRNRQLKRAQDMLLELIQTNSGSRLLKDKLERLLHLLAGHIRSASSSEIWNDRGEHIDIAISEINNIKHDVEPIPIINYKPPLLSNTNISANFEDESDENYRYSIPISQRRTVRSAKKSFAKSIKKNPRPSRRIISSRGT